MNNLIKILSLYPKNKLPPCQIYKQLVELTNKRNDWTCEQWIKFLKGEKI